MMKRPWQLPSLILCVLFFAGCDSPEPVAGKQDIPTAQEAGSEGMGSGAGAEQAGEAASAGEMGAALEGEPESALGKIEVIEFFLYTCPHCYSFEPYITEWAARQGEDVHFRQVPAIFSEVALLHAKTFYALQVLGVLQDHHQAIFEGIHDARERLEHKDVIRAFLEKRGVDGERFMSALSSEEVDDKVREAYLLGKKYELSSVPFLAVNEQTTSPAQAGSVEGALEELDRLIEQERGEAQAE